MCERERMRAAGRQAGREGDGEPGRQIDVDAVVRAPEPRRTPDLRESLVHARCSTVLRHEGGLSVSSVWQNEPEAGK